MGRIVGLVLTFAVLAAVADKPPVTDDTVHDQVIRRLVNDPELKTNAIEVTVKARVVTLRGMVETEKLRQRAERVARKVNGVKKIVNELRLRP